MASQAALDEREVARLTKDTVLFLLSEHTKNGSIKRADLSKRILNEAGRRTQNEVIKESKRILKKVYGLRVEELDENVKHFMLVNEGFNVADTPLQWSESELKEQALLLPILSVIFMNGGSISEREMWLFLKRLRFIQGSSRISEEFGDLEKLLKKDFVSQRYLTYTEVKVAGDNVDDEKVFQFEWGRRAEFEVVREEVLKHVSEIFECPVTNFPEQYAQTRQ